MNLATRTIGIIFLGSGLAACGSMTNTEAGTAIGAAGARGCFCPTTHGITP